MNNIKKRIVIPVRMASTRLPNKPLLDILGKPMVQRVFEKAIQCNFDSVIIATDDERIKEVAKKFGAKVCMTSKNHESGTDRIAEVVYKENYEENDIIINIQGDEPLIPIENVIQVANNLENNNVEMATLSEKILAKEEILNPNVVKVIKDKKDNALYFSRAPIPWARGFFPESIPDNINFYRHIGLYAYKAGFLKTYSNLEKSILEGVESLEQLRILWHGYKINVGLAKKETPAGVDTIDDLERVRRILLRKNK